MNNNFFKIMENIKEENKIFENYSEFYLDKYYFIEDSNIKNYLNLYKKDNLKIKIFFNNNTKKFNNIGIIDTSTNRIIDLDDDYYTMENKGICKQIEFL